MTLNCYFTLTLFSDRYVYTPVSAFRDICVKAAKKPVQIALKTRDARISFRSYHCPLVWNSLSRAI